MKLSSSGLAEVRRLNRERYPCKVRGCKRTAYRGAICKAHWDMIPQRKKVALTIATYHAQMTTAERFHRKFLRELNAGQRAT